MKALRSFVNNSQLKSYAKGELIFSQGMPYSHVYIIKSGIVRCYDISVDGIEQLIWLEGKNEIFPLPYLFDVVDEAKFFYSAFSDVELYVVDKTKLQDYLAQHPVMLMELCREVTRKYFDLQFRVNASGKPKAKEKILHTLAFVADRFQNGGTKHEKIELSLPLTHQDIADLVGLTRETTATTLKQLRDEGFIEYDRVHFVVFRDKIEETLW